MASDSKVANALSGKTARACDGCIRRRARWYCPADDAFLCQGCDGSVHSANPLAHRHERVRLKTASLKRAAADDHLQQQPELPSWQRGLTRKPRTPRQGKSHQSKSEDRNPVVHVTVPELGAEDSTSSHDDETEDQLLYQVPVFDPFVTTEFHSPSTGYDIRPSEELEGISDADAAKNTMFGSSKSPPDEYMPSDMDLEEFAADVETLLGKGFDDESYQYSIEELGLLGCSPSNNNNNIIGKVTKEEDEYYGNEGDIMIRGFGEIIQQGETNGNNNNVVIKEPFELTFDYNDHHDFSTTCQGQGQGRLQEDEHKTVMMIEPSMVNELWKVEGDDNDNNNDNGNDDCKEVMLMNNKRRKVLLRLDYEAISAAWNNQVSPWINGQRPQINLDDCWPHCMGTCGHGSHHLYGGNNNNHQMGRIEGNNNGGNGDGGREARVSRYREKRRTRLFSKKIRYEVRKLNAEKRPRMKGRFVKRSSFVAATTTTATAM